jgi:lactate racemase
LSPPVVGEGGPERDLGAEDVTRVLREALSSLPLGGKRVLVIIPDGTRSMPMPLMFEQLEALLAPRVAALDYLVALGTHQPMSDEQLSRLIGCPVADGRAGRARVLNHRWDDPATFVTLGTIPSQEIAEITGGRLERDVDVSLNRLILDYDHLIVCGPVFPHEVAGFSGGTKYFFPGIAGSEIIDFTHWLGALLTSSDVIGTAATPVRAVIDRAARLIQTPTTFLCLVVCHAGLRGLYAGAYPEAWRAAVRLSAQVHIRRMARPFARVLSVMPEMYADLWTAGKGMYKLEPVVADGGEIVIYAPHIDEVSYTHGRLIDEIGYHCREYFLAQWERFRGYPGGVLAHSTHVKGRGRYDPATGQETPRIRVTLATRIPRERCERINLGYLDPATVRPAEWEGREGEGVLLVPRAGERLYRLGSEK